MTEIKIVIPARYGSLRLPGKPLLLLKGKPIFWHVVQRALESGVKLADIYLATDDERIVLEAKNLNIPVFMTSKQHASGTDRVNEVANALGWSPKTIVINLQGDEPLVPCELIKELIDFTIKNEDFDITTAVCDVTSLKEFHNPNVVKVILGEKNKALYFTRSAAPFNREDPNCFELAFRHIGIYAYRKEAINSLCNFSESSLEYCEKLEQLRALSNGMTIGAIKLLYNPAHGIDTNEDYLKIKCIMEE